jgi:hypothetical protein
VVRVGDARRVSMMIEQECCSEGVAFFGGVGRKERGGDSGVRVSVFGAGGRSVVVSSIMQRRQAGRAQAGKQASRQASKRKRAGNGWLVDGSRESFGLVVQSRVFVRRGLRVCAGVYYYYVPYANHSLLGYFSIYTTAHLPPSLQSLDLLALFLPHLTHSITPHPRRVRLSLACPGAG